MVSRSRVPTLRAVGVLAALVVLLALVAPVPAAGEDRSWRSPIEADVSEGFRPPDQRWGSGNRGLAYAAEHGQPVAAVADGTVTFAGPVGGQLHVTVDHGGGLRSTYAFLATVTVVRGQSVRQGQPIATATPGFHLTARLGGAYVDPADLLAGGVGQPRLLPTTAAGRSGGTADGPGGFSFGRGLQRLGSGLVDAAGDGIGAVSSLVDTADRAATAAAGRLSDAAGTLVDVAAHGAARAVSQGRFSPAEVVLGGLVDLLPASFDPARALFQLIYDLLPVTQLVAIAKAITSWHRSDEDCTADDVAVPPGGDGRVLIQVGGLGTSSNGASIAKLDPDSVGYDPRDVIGFSYAGGCTPTPFGFEATPAGSLSAELDASHYSAVHTHQDLDVSATRLADLIDDVRAVRPDAPIDLAAHSLGGVVVRRALEILDRRHGDQPDGVPVSVVLTLGSPHQGAELATAAVAIRADPRLPVLLAGVAPDRFIESRATSVTQLARGTSTQLPPPTEPPEGVRVVSVAAPGDVVVPAERSYWPGATNTIAGPWNGVALDAHGQLPARPEAHRELALAIAGLPARCIAFATAVGSALTSRVVSSMEGGAAAGAVVLVP